MKNKMKNKMKENDVVLHGECMVYLSKLPADAVKMKVEGNKVIVAPSETTGNHHYVDSKEGVEFFEGINGTLYMVNTVETSINCMVDARHSKINLPAGTYEFGSQQEYDPFTARLQKVRD